MNDKSNDICPKCSKLLDSEGLCWDCLTREYNETKTIVEGIGVDGIHIGKKLGYGVYNDIRNKTPKSND